MPAMRTKLHLIADEPGSFRGLSSNISGKGFAGMSFTAVSSNQEDFDEWVQTVKESSLSLSLEDYNLLVAPSEYHPVTYYSQVDDGLFDHIIMKYMNPES
jgi:cytochrome o ubiquinol oxidase subunit 2